MPVNDQDTFVASKEIGLWSQALRLNNKWDSPSEFGPTTVLVQYNLLP
jgi:hypothetical protein